MTHTTQDDQQLRTAILEAALDSIITIDDAGRVIDWNPAAARTFGYAHDEATGRRLSDLIIPEHLRGAHERGMRRYLDTGEARVLGRRVHLEAQHRDGHIFPCELTILPITLSTGRYFTAYLRDLSEQRRQEEALQQATQRATRLSAVMSALASVTSEGDVARVILEEGAPALDAVAATVFMRRAHHLELLQYQGSASDEVQDQYRELPLDVPMPVAPVMRTGQPLFLTQEDLTREFPQASHALNLAHPGAHVAVFPLTAQDETLGALTFIFERDLPSSAEDRQFMEHLALQCAQALHRVNLQAEVRSSEVRFRSLVEATTSIVWTRDARGHFVVPQPQWAAATGQDWAEYRGLGWLDAIHPDDRPNAERTALENVARGVKYQNEYRLRLRSGQYRTMAVTAVPLLTPAGDVQEWVGFHRDVTDERQAQQRTHALYALASTLSDVNAAPDAAALILRHALAGLHADAGAVWTVSPDGLRALAVHGYPTALTERLQHLPLDASTPVADAVHTHSLQAGPLSTLHGPAAEGDDGHLVVAPLLVNGHATGALMLSFARSCPLTAAERTFLEVFAQQAARAFDQIHAYERARQSEARLGGIISTVSDAIITTDEAQRILLFNTAAERMFGTRAEDVLGGSLDRFMPGRYRAQHAGHMRRFGETGVTARAMHEARGALPALRADGTEFLVEATISQVVIDHQRLFTAVIRDVTEQRRAEQVLWESEERFRATFSQAAVGLAHVGLDGTWLSVNDKLGDLLGYTPEELQQRTFADITHPDDLNADLGYVHQLLNGQLRTYSMQKRYVRKDGQNIWANLTVSLVRDEAGNPNYFISVVEDITDIKDAEAQLRAAHNELEARVEERTAALQDLSGQLQTQVQELEHRNEETRVLGEMNEMLQACVSLNEAYHVVGHYAALLFPDHGGKLYAFGPSRNVLEEAAAWNGAPPSDTIFAPSECWGLRRGRTFLTDGALRCQHIHAPTPALCVPLLAQGEAVGLLHLVAPDVERFTARQQRLAQTIAESVALAMVNLRLRESLRQQSIRDALTGLFNRRYLEETFEREMRRAHRHRHPMGLIMLDIDHFKRFNDTYGHEAGDLLLRALGETLSANVRGEDVACRFGGEEFALLLPGATIEQTAARAEHIRQAVMQLHVTVRGQALGQVTASFGVAVFPQYGEALADLMHAADFALYRAKSEGRNCVVTAE
ncbi:PAS domain S-box protein [Deinococcus maricopensis]|uniref:Diguanylate cyclase with PAS/PAC and GAF sensors n=1 Tax=Deinococcus maricopensis (strain DSM 21211 / LMG 22137 / NRRL B-23946 / LB-34) TaxID=709986 RepID=E8U638_DEIML|nr:PAS domain S-box protein [Deinococcus maricopensis]ADV66527.1 diguanylate cyclase with PAS/PAC and GAF sensors [Deinococcus maricopensis DSM 21211]